MSRIHDLIMVLSVEPERSLHYLIGEKIADLKHLQDRSYSRFRGPFMSTLWFLVRPWIKREISFANEKPSAPVDYFVYAGTGNQFKALDGFVAASLKRGMRCRFVVPPSLIKEHQAEGYCHAYTYCLSDLIVSYHVAFLRTFRRKKELAHLPSKVRDRAYHVFLALYVQLPYFLRVLSELKPGYVVVSNDHSPGPRCLIAVAHYLGIKTVYMQHASVSPLFPALRFSYAFLDGEKALRVYEVCESNFPGDVTGYKKPMVFLSGQKKQLTLDSGRADKVVGLAVNVLDSVEAILGLVRRLRSEGLRVLLRWHPRQSRVDVDRLLSELSADPQVQFSDPTEQHVSLFLEAISDMVAGNSSIHLEAAVMGIKTIYFELAPPASPDYYGYVKEGVSLHARTFEELMGILNEAHTDSIKGRGAAVRHYSETYGTPWSGNEGELVAETLHRLSAGMEVKSIYGRVVSSPVFGDVHGLQALVADGKSPAASSFQQPDSAISR